MEVKYTYSKVQLEAAVQFIGRHNEHFENRFDYIRKSILDNMKELAEHFPNCYYIGTMGYLISADVVSEEDIDNDENSVMFDITVDPAVGIDKWDSDNTVDVNIEVKINENKSSDESI